MEQPFVPDHCHWSGSFYKADPKDESKALLCQRTTCGHTVLKDSKADKCPHCERPITRE